MQSSLHASSGALEWVVAGYALTSAVFLIGGTRRAPGLGGDHDGAPSPLEPR